MEIPNRPIRIVYVQGVGLLCSDVTGRLHVLDEELRVVRSSPNVPGMGPGYAIAVSPPWVVTKDPYGNLCKWSLETLDPTNYLNGASVCDRRTLLPGEEPSPAIHRGITVWRDRVYTNNGYMQFVILDLDTFSVERIVPSPTGSFFPIEWISIEHPLVHAISDKDGQLFLGHLDTLVFPVRLRLDAGTNLHRVRYDRRWDRFWVTQDSGEQENYNVANGVVTVLADGTVEQRTKFARDDVEFLEFSADGSRAYSGGFDGVLHIFDNSERTLRIERSVEGFSHQLIDMAMGPRGLFLLSQDGEIIEVTPSGDFVRRAPFRRQCVWDVQPSREDDATLYCATDDGVAVVHAGNLADSSRVHLRLASHHTHDYGFVRRLVAVPGGWIGTTRDERVLRSKVDGEQIWCVELETRAHTLAVDPEDARVLVATNAGAIEFDAASGTELDRVNVEDLPIWCVAYLPDGGFALATRNGQICAFGREGDRRWMVETGNYPKRMWVQGDSLFVTGGGGLREIPLDGSGVAQRWEELLNNTCENAVILDDFVYVVTYGSQIGWFARGADQMIGSVERLLDFPKGLAVLNASDGGRLLVVGGRGGYLTTYRLAADGEPLKLHDLYIPRTGYGGYAEEGGRLHESVALAV